MQRQAFTLIAALAAVTGAYAQLTATGEAAPIPISLQGNTQHDLWSTLSAATHTGYPGFPGTSSWPAPIESNEGQDGNVTKVSNGAGGGPYVGNSSIYFGGFSSDINNFGGTLAVNDATPVADLNTVVFQLQIAEAWTWDLWNDAGAVLNFNGGNQQLAATYRSLVAQEFTGTVEMPSGTENLYTNLHAFQWDLSGINDPITSYSIVFSGVQHSQIYGMQLDQTDAVYNTEVVPEPATLTLAALAGIAALRRRKKA